MTGEAPRPETSCLPCTRGAHLLCRHYPDGPRFGRGDKSEPCRCEESGHAIGRDTCAKDVDTGPFTTARCGLPVKGEVPASYTWNGTAPDELVGVCGRHLAGYRRRVANDAARDERARAQREEWRRADELKRAMTETADRLRPLLEGLGIRPDTLTIGQHGLQLPAEAMETLVRLAVEGDELRQM